jgi:hypothetical protein
MRKSFVCACVAALVSAAAFAAPPSSQPPKVAAPNAPTLKRTPNLGVVRSCARQLTVKAQIDNAELHSKYGANYNAVNFNEVKVDVYNSYVSGNDLLCQYRSANRDIPNLVYKIPCPGATPANNGYEHAYRCTN